jgi:hypothetical protein
MGRYSSRCSLAHFPHQGSCGPVASGYPHRGSPHLPQSPELDIDCLIHFEAFFFLEITLRWGRMLWVRRSLTAFFLLVYFCNSSFVCFLGKLVRVSSEY